LFLHQWHRTKKIDMKKNILSLVAGAALVFAAACNDANDESKNADSTATSGDANSGVSSGSSKVQATSEGRSYILRARGGATASTEGTASASVEYDTVWLQMGTADRYYYLHGPEDRDTLYFDTDEWNAWWSNPETDKEIKAKSGNTKIKVDADGSYKVKDDTSKVKVNEKGKVKVKPKG
jgi:hypothetical protein